MYDTASAPQVCSYCVESHGLCSTHALSVLPQLAQPFWYRHAHSGMYYETGKDKPSPEAQRLIARKERRALKRKASRRADLHVGLGLAA